MNDQTRTQAFDLHERIQLLLESLPATPSARRMGVALLRLANTALTRREVTTLEKVYREAQVLLRSLTGTVDGFHVTRRPRRISRVREHAPIRYPYGEPPVSPPRRSDPVISKPYHGKQPFVDPWRAMVREEEYQRDQAVMQHGRMRCTGPDDPPEYYWPEPAD